MKEEAEGAKDESRAQIALNEATTQEEIQLAHQLIKTA